MLKLSLSRRIAVSPCVLPCLARLRCLATAAQKLPDTGFAGKAEGDIGSFFSSLGADAVDLPPRFMGLKRELWNENLVDAWRDVLKELEGRTDEIISKGNQIIPQISYADLSRGLSEEQERQVRKTGVIIVKGAVPKEEALVWKQAIRDYAVENKERVKGTKQVLTLDFLLLMTPVAFWNIGFPADNIQVYEFYNTKSQVLARTHPSILDTQRKLLRLWKASDPSTEISLNTPISYFDRLRIRHPGDQTFTLGPHIDGGSIERWEDPGYRSCFQKILEGRWREHNPFDASPRIHAKQDLYNAPNQCSIFRPWQGWTALSSTGPNEGTLRVLPMLALSTAYIMLRPFFRPKSLQSTSGWSSSTSLKPEDWELDLSSTKFPGAAMGKGLEPSEKMHFHLKLDKTMVSIPKVEPGDQVYWHCDLVHAVESQHEGKGDSSVLYIPAVPLTTYNANYLRHQRNNFVSGHPAPDFPGGVGESNNTGRGSRNDIKTRDGLQAFGFEPFEVKGSDNPGFVEKANAILAA
ncbi:hypothetical protein D9758_008386 [Tetrapyrgos nigripes]|uniref:DUF1479-domain-containing protein n=1 Tax=Tetrapyrgos nigripes TaxID=182062 RepID=A0A8H5GE12_9AGAR|nr:hypothetical protein D9758_008386 [Tetrapyrgos nigripes]